MPLRRSHAGGRAGVALPVALALAASAACQASASSPASAPPALHLDLVADVPLPGGATRFDYQAIDAAHGHLVVAHMNDASVLVLDLATGSVVKELPGIPVARGVAVGDGRIFVTSSPASLVIVDAVTLAEVGRVTTGNGPDGVASDPVHHLVAVSDQRDGAISILEGSGSGARHDVHLGSETGNVVYDAGRSLFWISVVGGVATDELVAVDPLKRTVVSRLALPGCKGAHGVRLHPDGHSALVACEDDDRLARVDLDGAHAVTTAATGNGPDVLDLDPALGRVYVAAESGDLVAFDVAHPGLTLVGRAHPGDAAHTIAVDAVTHRLFFPLPSGSGGRPVLRIMKPSVAAVTPSRAR